MGNFEDTVRQFTPMIRSIIRSLHIYKNHGEFFQTGLIALWEAEQRFDSAKGVFSNYAYTYIKGNILNELNKERRLEERTVYPEDTFWEYAAAECWDQALERDIIVDYCQGLTPKQKEWVLSAVYHGMSVSEIACRHRVSESAVKKWKKGALDHIRSRLAEG